MNERIKELSKEAFEYALIQHPGSDEFQPIWTEKFAELIVEKFDNILVLEHLDCVGNRDKQAAERVERLREKVKTYFGVEE